MPSPISPWKCWPTYLMSSNVIERAPVWSTFGARRSTSKLLPIARPKRHFRSLMTAHRSQYPPRGTTGTMRCALMSLDVEALLQLPRATPLFREAWSYYGEKRRHLILR